MLGIKWVVDDTLKIKKPNKVISFLGYSEDWLRMEYFVLDGYFINRSECMRAAIMDAFVYGFPNTNVDYDLEVRKGLPLTVTIGEKLFNLYDSIPNMYKSRVMRIIIHEYIKKIL